MWGVEVLICGYCTQEVNSAYTALEYNLGRLLVADCVCQSVSRLHRFRIAASSLL